MTTPSNARSFAQRDEIARLLSTFDWEAIDFDPPEAWPASLRAVVDLVLDCRIPMMMGLGPDLRLLYNDGYIPILGDKHPVIGTRCEEAFGELWSVVGPILRGVYETGEAILREDQLLPLDRRGFVEECYFTFSYSPLRDGEGTVIGLLSTAVETTSSVIGARRDAVLQALGTPHAEGDPDEVVAQACRELEDVRDLPFHLLWLPDDDGRLRLVSSAGITPPHDEPVERERLVREGWAVAGSNAGEVVRVPLERLPPLRLDPGVEVPVTHAAILSPLDGEHAGTPAEAGLLVTGVAADVPWDDAYGSFVERVGEKLGRHHDAHRLRALLVAEAEDRYHQLFMQALDGIILGRPRGDILAANPAACDMLGYTEAELVRGGRPMVQDPDDPRWEKGLEVRQATRGFTGELDFLHRSGRTVPCEVSSRTYLGARGELRSTVVMRDVTERKALQARLGEAQKMEVVARVSGGIAHDFNNLLTVIDSQLDLLREEMPDRPELHTDLDLIAQTSHRAAALIRRLLDFTRRFQGEARAFDPAAALAEMAPLLRRLVGSGCELSIALSDEVRNVTMAPEQFEQVVMNLVVNARDAVEEAGRGGTIEVSLEADADAVRLEIRDDGIGIAADQLDLVFDAFHSTKPQGTGIGLSTVRLLVEEAGGRVEVGSTPGVGSTFTVRLPGVEPVDEVAESGGEVSESAPSESEASGSETPSTGQRLDGVRLLLVDDQAHLRRVLERVLERVGAEVTVAANGEQALRIARQTPLDGVVSDVVMPLMSGPELVRHLREELPDLPVVLMSGYATDDVLSAEMLEDVLLLTKPFASRELVAAVRAVLEPER